MRDVAMLKIRNPNMLQDYVCIRKHGKNQDQRNDEPCLQRPRGGFAQKIGKTDVTDSERFALLLSCPKRKLAI